MKVRRLIFGFLTILNIKKLGFFIPHRYASKLKRSGSGYPWLREWFLNDKKEKFIEVLQLLAPYLEELKAIEFNSQGKNQPRWGQDWFPGLDAAVAYGFVRLKKPKRIIEIGSGHSTRFLLRAIEDEGLGTILTCIDPEPRASVGTDKINLIKKPVQKVTYQELPQLQPGDILLIDSSHIAISGSDVDWVVNHIIPYLPEGVLVHFHDIFFPDSYPLNWKWREYNEDLIVAALLAGGRLDPIFSSYYVRNYLPNSVKKHGFSWLPVLSSAHESSLWAETEGSRLI